MTTARPRRTRSPTTRTPSAATQAARVPPSAPSAVLSCLLLLLRGRRPHLDRGQPRPNGPLVCVNVEQLHPRRLAASDRHRRSSHTQGARHRVAHRIVRRPSTAPRARRPPARHRLRRADRAATARIRAWRRAWLAQQVSSWPSSSDVAGCELSLPVDVPSMPDGDYLHHDLCLDDAVHHPKLPSTGGEQACKWFPKTLAYAIRVFGEWPEDELETGNRNSLREFVCQGPSGLPRQPNLVSHIRPDARIAASTSSLE